LNELTGAFGVATGTTSWSASIPLSGGSNTITVTASDASGNEASASITIGFSPPFDALLPSLTITGPTSTTTLSTPVTVGGIASDNVGVSVVTWTNAATGGDGVAGGTTLWSASIPLAAGDNLITMTAADPSSNVASDTIIITYVPSTDPIPPSVHITSLTTIGPLFKLIGTASDNQGIATVTWSNAETGGSGTADGTTSWTAEVPIVPGSNTVTITAFDLSGNTGIESITVLYDTLAGGGGQPAGGGSRGKRCGLLGIEPLILFAVLRLLRKRI
jgi:hypothetical protein